MNVNPSSADFGKVVPWDSLTDEQKTSGDWILLPDVSNQPRRARKSEEAQIREIRQQQSMVDQSMVDRFLASSAPAAKGSFDALGRAR